jgi:hypothetical protein
MARRQLTEEELREKRERRRREKGVIPREILEWRRRQPPSAIMRPETFRKIERKAKEYGATDPTAVAGAAYWKTVEAKFRRVKHKKGPHSPTTWATVNIGLKKLALT